jgi:hypothetical protein
VETGAVCQRPTNEPGVDTCVPGQFCTLYGLPESDPLVRICQPLCRPDHACAAQTVCRRIGNSPDAGVCMPPCDPLAGDPCGDGLTCGRQYVIDRVGTATVCDWTNEAGAAGAACTWDWDCAAGLGCHLPTGQCRAWCDADHPCAAGTCEPTMDVVVESRGVCVP